MINGQYLYSELTNRGRRTLVNVGLVALVTAVLVCITLLSDALNIAFQAPLAAIGADMTVQKAGDVPEQMAGPVLPCSVAPISRSQSDAIAALPAVISLSRAVLFWDFSRDTFRIVVGFRPGDRAGPALLQGTMISGKMIEPADRQQALAEVTWASETGVGPGDKVIIGGRSFTVAGLVDGSAIGRIGTANLFISLAAAQDIVAAAPGISAIHQFGPRDSNLLFLQAKRDKADEVSRRIKEILGEKATVSTPDSFKELIGGLFSLTQRFSGMISSLVVVLALLLIGRNSAAAVGERITEIGTMKAVGWTGRDIIGQLLAENLLYIGLGTLFGLGLGALAAWTLSFVTISIPIPWDMAPTPHFLPGGDQQLSQEIRLPITAGRRLPFLVTGMALLLGLAAAWGTGRLMTRLHTSEVLRHE